MRDTVFAEGLKAVVIWEVPVLAWGFLSGNSFPAALGMFLAGVRAVAPPIIDYARAKRAVGRNAYAYLLRLKPSMRVDLKV